MSLSNRGKKREAQRRSRVEMKADNRDVVTTAKPSTQEPPEAG